MFLTATNSALKCVIPHIMESFLFSIGPTVTVILTKYFFQQKRTYPIKIFFLTLGVAGGGIFFHGSLPLVGLSSHVHHVLASSRLLGVQPISAGSQTPFFSPTINPFLFPRGDLGINSSL